MSEVNKYAGQVIRTKRLLKHWSQRHLAEQIGVTYQQVQKYESGKNAITLEKLYRICFVLNSSPNEFIMGSHRSDGHVATFSPAEVRIVGALRAIPESNRQDLANLINRLAGVAS